MVKLASLRGSHRLVHAQFLKLFCECYAYCMLYIIHQFHSLSYDMSIASSESEFSTECDLVWGWLTYGTVPTISRRQISSQRGIHCRLKLLILLLGQRLYIVKNVCVCVCMCVCVYPHTHTHTHTHICNSLQTVNDVPLLPNNTNQNGKKCWLDIYHWGAGLAGTWRIRDIGQNVLESSFPTGSSSSRHSSFLIAFLEKVFARNIIIILCINYIIIKCISNEEIIKNKYGSFQDLILLFKLPMGTRKDFFRNL